MKPFRKYKKGDMPTAQEMNRLTAIAEKVERSVLANSFHDGSGIYKRWPHLQTGADIRIFEVQSAATGDGIYNCYEQTLDATEWDDTAGDDKFDDKNTTSIEVFNLLENNPAASYMSGLIAGDRIAAWQWADDEGTTRWVGIPIVASTRRAKIQSGGVGASTLTVKLLNNAGTETGNAITVYPIEHLGTNDLSGDVWPDLAATDIISVFQDINGNYYTTFVFDDITTCD